MEIIKRIQARLEDLGWGWADLARALDITEQRLNNWKKRGIPAGQIKSVANALGITRYQLEGEAVSLRELTGEQIKALEIWSALMPEERAEMESLSKRNKAVLAQLGGQPRALEYLKDRLPEDEPTDLTRQWVKQKRAELDRRKQEIAVENDRRSKHERRGD